MVEVKFDVNKVLQDRLASSMGLDKYKKIVEIVNTVDVSENADFQRLFNGFYLVRRNAEWREIFYDLFEAVKGKNPTFAEIITHLYKKTGNIEASFSSKMLATICHDKPIWDRYVVQNLQLKLEGDTKEEKLANAIKLYSDIEEWYEEFLQTEQAKECIAGFDAALPEYAWLSDIKKVDSILWSIR